MSIPSYAQRMRWFHQARFGIFVHWGLYSLLGRGEWTMFQERIPAAEYAKLADRFRPRRFDADAWAGLAAEAGAKYMVLTTRHHDGFCLYDSAVSDFTSVKTAARRDFVAEYVRACRKAGIRVGLYYSLLDWRFPGYFAPKRHRASAAALVQQVHDQVRELMSNYGRIDELWYDGDWIGHGEAGIEDKARFWRAKQLNAMVRRLQPSILINNRSGTEEDLDTPEQHVQASKAGRGWEACMTMGHFTGWGWQQHNPHWKSVPQLIEGLTSAAAGEGNFLLNIGPRPDGTIRREEVVRLRAMGAWLQANGKAIYGSQRCDLPGGQGGTVTPTGPVSQIGRWTRKGRTGYLIIDRWPGREAVVPLVSTRVRSVRMLAGGLRLGHRQESNGRLVITGLPDKPPHPAATVLADEFISEPHRLVPSDPAAWIDGRAGQWSAPGSEQSEVGGS